MCLCGTSVFWNLVLCPLVDTANYFAVRVTRLFLPTRVAVFSSYLVFVRCDGTAYPVDFTAYLKNVSEYSINFLSNSEEFIKRLETENGGFEAFRWGLNDAKNERNHRNALSVICDILL